MSWLFERRGDKFRIYSTVVDNHLSGWMDRREMLRMIYAERLRQFKLDIVRLYMEFPHMKGLYKKGSGSTECIIDEERAELFSKWMEEMWSGDGEYSIEFLNRTYKEALEFLELDTKSLDKS